MIEPNKTPEHFAAQLEQMERYLHQDPSNPSLLLRAFDLAMHARAFVVARRYVDLALEAQPDDPYWRFRQAEVLSALGQWQDAEALYGGLLQTSPEPNVAFGLARSQAQRGNGAASIVTLWPYRLASEFPVFGATLLVRLLHHAGRGQDAMEYVTAVEARFDTDTTFCAAASLVALDEGNMALAMRLSKQAQAGGAEPLEALVVDATVALGNLEVDAARANFERALASMPDEARSLAGLGAVHVIERDFAHALPLLEAAHKSMPEHIGTMHLLAWCKLFLADLPGAEAMFAQALTVDRNFADSHGGMAVVLAMQGDRSRAEHEVKVALRLDPTALSANYAVLVLAGDTNEPERFNRLAERILEDHEMAEGMTMAALLRKYRGT